MVDDGGLEWADGEIPVVGSIVVILHTTHCICTAML